jgi:hypothetical protein
MAKSGDFTLTRDIDRNKSLVATEEVENESANSSDRYASCIISTELTTAHY